MIEWNLKYVIRMPIVSEPHAAVFSFLRTSEYGIWEVRHDESSDAFVQHFRRGETYRVRAIFGFGGVEKPLGPGIKGPLDRTFMELRVTFRPSPDSLTIGLYYSVPGVFSLESPVGKRVTEYVHGEMQALASYLKEFYSLPEVPRIAAQ